MAEWKKVITGSDSVNALTDVDTSSVAAEDTLKWNGSSFVVAKYDEAVTFTVNSVSTTENDSSLIEMGSGSWKANLGIIWTLSYDHGPMDASSGKVTSSDMGFGDGLVYGVNGSIGDSTATTKNTAQINYPTGTGSDDASYGWKHEWTSSGHVKGSITGASKTGDFKFANKAYYGIVASNAAAPSETTIEGLAGTLTNSVGQKNSGSSPKTWAAVNVTSGNYYCLAVPARLNDIVLRDGSGGGNELAVTSDSPHTVNITNGNGHAEDYSVWISENSGLGSIQLWTNKKS